MHATGLHLPMRPRATACKPHAAASPWARRCSGWALLVATLPLHVQTPCSGVTMGETLRRLGPSLELAPMQQSAFVKPHSIMFQLDGECHASAMLLLLLLLLLGAAIRVPAHPMAPAAFTMTHIACLASALRLTSAGKPRRWDMVVSHPSVAVLLYHRQRQAVVLVRQVGCCACCACWACCCLLLLWCIVPCYAALQLHCSSCSKCFLAAAAACATTVISCMARDTHR